MPNRFQQSTALRFLIFTGILLSSFSFAQPAANNPAPIQGTISPLEKFTFQYGGRGGVGPYTNAMVLPRREKLAFAWSDQPFALRIPFEVTVPPGEPSVVLFDLRCRVEGTPSGAERSPVLPLKASSSPAKGGLVWGVMMPTEAPLPPGFKAGTVDAGAFFLMSSPLVAAPGPLAPTGQPQPTNSSITLAGGPALDSPNYSPSDFSFGNTIWADDGDYRPFTGWDRNDPRLQYVSRSPLVIEVPATAPRGWYELWITIPTDAIYRLAGHFPTNWSSSGAKLKLPETLRGRFTATMLQANRPARASSFRIQPSIQAALGNAPAITNAQQRGLEWKRSPDVETDFMLRLNGWLLSEVVTMVNPKVKWPLEERQPSKIVKTTAEGTVNGNVAQFAFSETRWEQKLKPGPPGSPRVPDGPPTNAGVNSTSYRIEFPRAIADYAFCDVVITGDLKSGLKFWERICCWSAGSYDPFVNEPFVQRRIWVDPISFYRTKDELVRKFGARAAEDWLEPEKLPDTRSAGERKKTLRHWIGAAGTSGPFQAALDKLDAQAFPYKGVGVGEGLAFGGAVGLYKRRCEIESNLEGNARLYVGSEPELIVDDGYWEWLPGFAAESSDAMARLAEIRFSLAGLAKERRGLRRQHFIRTAQEMELLREGDLLEPGQGLGQKAKESSDRERNRILKETEDRRAEQEQLVAEATGLMKSLVDSAKRQAARSAEKKRDHKLDRVVKQFEAQQAMLELNLLDAAEWFEPNELPRVIEKYDFKSGALGTLARTLHARWLMARAEQLEQQLRYQMVFSPTPLAPGTPVELAAREARLNAYYELRDVRRENPDNSLASQLQRELEQHFVKQIATKLDHEKQASLAGFANYLNKRGFDVQNPDGWWQSSKEFFYVFFTSGPITLLGGIMDAPGGVADATAIAQEEIARDNVSLTAIMRLLRNGFTLEAIRKLDTEGFKRALLLNTASGQPLDSEKARQIGQDIHATLAGLYDLRALAEGNVDEFKRLYAKDYYESFDTDQSWAEWIGDIFSPRHLLTLFGPGAIVKVGGEWALVGRMTSAEIQSLEAAGQVTRGRDAFIAAMRLERAAKAFSGTRAGAWLTGAMAEDRAFMEALEGWSKFRRIGSRVVAAVILYGGAAHLADESGVPGLRLVVDAVGELSGEEMAYDLLSRCGTPMAKLSRQVDAYDRIVRRELDRLELLRKQRERIEGVAQRAESRASKGQVVLNENELSEIQALVPKEKPEPVADLGFGPASRNQEELVIPQLTPSDALDEAMEEGRKAIAKGDVAESKRALAASKKLEETLDAAAEEAKRKAAQAKAALGGSGTKARASQQVGSGFEPVGKLVDPPPRLFDPADYAAEETGALLREADEAMRRGEYDDALRKYREATQRADDRAASIIGDIPDDIMERRQWLIRGNRYRDRIKLAEAAELASKKLKASQAAAALDAGQPFAKNEIESIFQRLKSNDPAQKLTMEPRPGSLNPVFDIKDAQGNVLFIFKQLDNNEELMTEGASVALINAAGGRAPAAGRAHFDGITLTYKDKFGTVHTKDASGLISRFVPGTTMSKLTEPEIIALKKEFASQKVFRAWLCETDGHLGNVIINNGRAYPFDFGYAQLRGTRRMKQNGEKFTAAGEEQFMKDCLNMPKDGYFSPHAQYAYLTRLDDLLQAEGDEMARTVSLIQNLCKDDAKLLQALEPHFILDGVDDATRAIKVREMEETMSVLKKRAEALQRVVESQFPKHLSAIRPLDAGKLMAVNFRSASLMLAAA